MRSWLSIVALAACGHGSSGSTDVHDVTPRTPACTAVVGGTGVVGEPYPDWRAAWMALRGSGGASAPASEADARARLCGVGGCPGLGPWVVTVATSDAGADLVVRTDLIFDAGRGLIVHAEVGGGEAGRCPWSDDVTVADDHGTVHLHGTRRSIAPCSPGPRDVDRFFDVSGYQLLQVVREPPASLELLGLAGHTLAIPGCAAPVAVPMIASAPTPTCPGDRTGEVCDIHLTPSCAPDQHLRVEACRPICVATADCLE